MTEHAAVLAALVLFGLAYNWLIGRIESAVPDHGYTAIWVIGGVLVTVLATVPIIGWTAVLTVLGAFAASGLIMTCLFSTSPSPRDRQQSRLPSSA